MIGGDSCLSGERIEIAAGASPGGAAIGSIFSSAFRRDCAWRALDALARKRFTKVHHVRAFGFLAFARALIDDQLLTPLPIKLREPAAIKLQLAFLEMQDERDGGIEQVAVVADQQDGPRIARDEVLQPKGAFEVEIVRRLVEEKQIGLGEEEGGERNAHAPAAGKLRARPLLRHFVKTKSGEYARGTRRSGMRVDVDEPVLDLGDAQRILCGFPLPQSARPARCPPRARPR